MSLPASSDFELISLDELSRLTKLPIRQLLRQGGSGNLRFCVPLPADIVVFAIDRWTLEMEGAANDVLKRNKLSRRLEAHGILRPHRVDLLILSQSDCRTLEKYSEFRQSLFDSGLALDSGAKVTETTPPNNSLSSPSGIGLEDFVRDPVWATYSRAQYATHPSATSLGFPQPIPLSLNTLHIFGLDLKEFMERNRQHAPLCVRPWTSNFLATMLQASSRFWRARYGQSKLKSEPYSRTHHEVILFLKNKGFSENQAKAAASAIRPVEARETSGSPENPVLLTFETPELVALFAASEYFWKDWDRSYPEDAPRNESVTEWLVKHHGFSPTFLGKIGPSLIRHDEAKRPQGKRKIDK